MADHLGLDRFTYVGHSMGGVIGMELGINHGSRLDKLVLVAPAPADGIELTPPMVANRERSARLRREGDRETIIRESLALAPRATEARVTRSTDRGLSVSAAHYDEAWDTLCSYRKGDQLKSVTTPTLVMAGAADGLLAANLKDFQQLPNATLHVFSRIGHGVNYDQPEQFAEILLDFLEHGVVTAQTLMNALRAPVAVGR
jgi:pimeloyl-ACP methyl ester carboxylesterase